MDVFDKLSNCTGFEWDENNATKNWFTHKVSPFECEQVFFNQPVVVNDDEKHSAKESRYYVLGQTDAGRLLYIVFTIRRNVIRVISARDMSRRERKVYKSL